MTEVNTDDRVVVSASATDSGDLQIVSVPTGFQGITSSNFAENEFLQGFLRHENGEDWEVYDFDGGDDDPALLQILNLSGTVIIARPAAPFRSSKSDNSRIDLGSGTHTLSLEIGSGTASRMYRELSPFWKTLTAADATPDVSGYRFLKSNGSTDITRFDGTKNGSRFLLLWGGTDITIKHDGTHIALFGGRDVTLTAANPAVEFAVVAGVSTQIVGFTKTRDEDGLTSNSATEPPSVRAVKAYVDAIVAVQDAMVFKGVIDCSANPNYPAADRGWTYRISVAGKIGGASGVNVEISDLLTCLTDGTLTGTQGAVGAAWTISQGNIDGAVIGPASAVGDNIATFNSTTGKVIKDSGKGFDTDGTLAANSDANIPTQKSVKTYVDAKAPTLASSPYSGGRSSRTVSDILRDGYLPSVWEFGTVTADGSTDDSAAITTALAQNRGLWFPYAAAGGAEAIYSAVGIAIPSDRCIICDPRRVNFKQGAGHMFTIGGSRITIENMVIDQTSQASTSHSTFRADTSAGSGGLELREIRMKNIRAGHSRSESGATTKGGYRLLDDANDTGTLIDWMLDDIVVYGAKAAPIYLRDAFAAFIFRSMVIDFTRQSTAPSYAGVDIDGGQGIHFELCNIQGFGSSGSGNSAGHGYVIANADAVDFNGCRSDGLGGIGLKLYNADGCQINNFTSSQCGEGQMYVDTCATLRVNGIYAGGRNQFGGGFSPASKPGIYVTASNEIDFNDANVLENTGAGVSLNSSSKVRFNGRTQYNTGDGAYVSGGGYNEVNGKLNNNGGNGLQGSGTSRLTARGDFLSNTGDGAKMVNSNSNRVKGNFVGNGGQGYNETGTSDYNMVEGGFDANTGGNLHLNGLKSRAVNWHASSGAFTPLSPVVGDVPNGGTTGQDY